MGEKTQGSSVLVKVSVEVVGEEVVELISSENVRAGVQHGASRKVLINGWVLPPVQLVHHHLPDGVGPGGARLEVAVTPVRHLEVHGVGPERRILEGGSDGGIVEESLLFHHGELVIATDPEVRSPEAHHRVVSDGGELLDDQPGAGHLPGPVLCPGLRPEGLVIVVGDGVRRNLVTKSVHVLDSRVVCVVVRHEEGALDVTAIRVSALLVEDLSVQVNVSDVDCVIEGEGDHLGDEGAPVILRTQVSGNLSAVL